MGGFQKIDQDIFDETMLIQEKLLKKYAEY